MQLKQFLLTSALFSFWMINYAAAMDVPKHGLSATDLLELKEISSDDEQETLCPEDLIASTSILDAARNNDLNEVNFWISRKKDPIDQRDDENGYTALHYAALFGNAKMANILLVAGASKLKKNTNGLTPCALACSLGNMELVSVLDPNPIKITSFSSSTPLPNLQKK